MVYMISNCVWRRTAEIMRVLFSSPAHIDRGNLADWDTTTAYQVYTQVYTDIEDPGRLGPGAFERPYLNHVN
jgi:hypothetical protein